MSDRPSAAWYLAPIFLGIIGSGIMWYVLKDEDHPDSTNSTVIDSTQHVSSVNGTSSPAQEQDDAISTGETTTSL